MLKITAITMNGCALRGEARYRVAGTRFPVFGWKTESSLPGNKLASFRVTVASLAGEIWDSGIVRRGVPRVKYTGPELPAWTELYVTVEITDTYGETAEAVDWFYSFASLPELTWITAPEAAKRRPVAFSKKLVLPERPASAMALYCGLGYCTFYVNGIRVDSGRLDPAFTDYSCRADCVFDEGFEGILREGENVLTFVVADGWRNFDSPFLIGDLGFPRPRFDGPNVLGAHLLFTFEHGETLDVDTGADWKWTYTGIVEASVYDGETFDAGAESEPARPAVECVPPCRGLEIMKVPPVTAHEVYRPVDIIAKDGEYIVDFGQNLAGTVRLTLPEAPSPGQRIVLKFAEVLDEEFGLYTAPLRKAKATDTYICAGDGSDGEFWQPEYTFHGFRYCSVAGYGEPLTPDKLRAVALYTDLEPAGDFRCGSPMLNALHKACVQTEKANIHSILSDCPQRDERMGWMNDATVRFEETPYNFEISAIFPKIVDDICDAAGTNGEITCTAPFVIGCRPADPVCSSFLAAGYQYYLRSGDVSFVAAHYDYWRRWEEYLLSRSDNYIVTYSYYGDWAAPVASCVAPENAASAQTPGILMSTGYSYYNCLTLAEFARVLGLTGDVGKWLTTARNIRAAFLDKWFDRETGRVATGSQGCQVFALKLGLLPPECRPLAYRRLLDALDECGNTITTGNLNTRYLFEVLTENGDVDRAFEILTGDNYPGYGFMLANGATTIWERFELKKDPGMNSHDHPMYAAVDRWFYAYILGITADCSAPGGTKYIVRPYFPEKLLSAQGWVETPLGRLSVRWKRTYGETQLSVSVPFAAECRIEAGGINETVGSGEHVYRF